MKRALLLLLLLPIACGKPSTPYVTTVGILKPGSTVTLRVANATVNAYAPAAGQPSDLYTLSATAQAKGTPPPAPHLHVRARDLTIDAPFALSSLLVRIPKSTDVVVLSGAGDVNVTDISGNARVQAVHGNVRVMIPGYAQASVIQGNLSVTMGARTWPGRLIFSTENGDVDLWIDPRVACNVRLHTGNGVLFTDFGLRGTSQGRSETIAGPLNGGGAQSIDVETNTGAIRLLRLQPQA